MHEGLLVADLDEKLAVYYRAVAQTRLPKVQGALDMIGAPPLQLLALRRYVRIGKGVETRWVWSDEQVKQWEHDHPGVIQGEISKVKEAFESRNEGYTLYATPFRDMKRQVDRWNHNTSVKNAAADLRAQCLKKIMEPAYPNLPDSGATERFRLFLHHCRVHPEPSNAAPGTSDHGQLRAFDFVVRQGARTVAGIEKSRVASEWDGPGWTAKLKEAVESSGSGFVGPLKEPYEPWHYTLEHVD